MTDLPAVSIVMPAYQAAETILASIQSVQDQTLANWELIIVDDGSTDDTAIIVQWAAEHDHRIRLIIQANQGPSAARNRGVALARSGIIAFLDADDHWANERLEGAIEALASQPSTGVLFSRTRFIDAKTGKPGTLTPFAPTLSAVDLMAENAVCSTSNIICRKEVFLQTGGFAEHLSYAEDQDWLLRVALDGRWKICGLNAEWFFYRSADNSQSADLEAMRLSWHKMAEAACSRFPDLAPSLMERAYGPLHRQLARRALRMGRWKTAYKYLRMALSKDPLLLVRQPRRTLFTLCGIIVAIVPSPAIKEFVAK